MGSVGTKEATGWSVGNSFLKKGEEGCGTL